MIRGFYTARTGLKAHQEHMNTIANNMANVNTHGFKPMRTAFKDLIYDNLNRPDVENEVMIGHGVKINKNDIMMGQGPLQPTNYALDYAILQENGYFAVTDAEETEVFYTRAGDFRLSEEDDNYYLVTGDGHYVLDEDESTIEVLFDEENKPILDVNIGVFSFPNHYGLSMVGNNRFAANEISGEAEALEDPNLLVKNGYLEGSGVEIAKEMADVIEASKAFSFSSRMVQVADEVEQTVNALR